LAFSAGLASGAKVGRLFVKITGKIFFPLSLFALLAGICFRKRQGGTKEQGNRTTEGGML
jgi:hypothetical protein